MVSTRRLAFLFLFAVTIVGRAADPLEEAFTAPPASAHPLTWWHWPNGNVSKTGITLDLEAMKRVGIAGVQLFEVGTGIPKGLVDYRSQEHRELLRFAISEADRLGLEFMLHNCPGYSSSGGPWITPDRSMKMLTFTETVISGGQRVELILSSPPARAGFYRDVSVIAYPTPSEDSRLADWRSKAGYPAEKAAQLPTPAETVVAATDAAAIDPTKVLSLSGAMDGQGRLAWDVPTGRWTVLRLGYTTTGTVNHPAPDGGEGLECDKFSRAAIDYHFEHFFGELWEPLRPLIAQGRAGAVIDSYERGRQNWTEEFPEEFKRRCGYDLTVWLPALTGRIVGSVERTERFLWDARKVQAGLMAENYYGRFAELCREHGLKSYFEPYGKGNFDGQAAGAFADEPMAEFWQDRPFLATVKAVASIAHVNGRATIAGESFTSESRWTDYPYSFKSIGDYVFTQGLNRYVFHTSATQSHPTAVPGMTMGQWGGNFVRTNTWFEPGRAWLAYATRAQALLQQGRSVADLLYFSSEDSPVDAVLRSLPDPVPPPGFGYDSINSDAILTRLKIVDGRIVLPDGMSYRAFVLAGRRAFTPDLIGRIRDLVTQGMTLIVDGPVPETSPSLSDYPRADDKVRAAARELWGDSSDRRGAEITIGAGRVFRHIPVGDVLAKLGVRPDFEATSRFGPAEINAIHRRLPGVDIYFVANREHRGDDIVCTFNIADRQPELWDAMTGRIAPAPVFECADGRTRVTLQLGPAGSTFVVFRRPAPARHLTAVLKEGVVVADTKPFAAKSVPAGPLIYPFQPRALTQIIPLPPPEPPPAIELAVERAGGLFAWENGGYTLQYSQGAATDLRITTIPAAIGITGPWRVTFPPDRGAPSEITLHKLISWSDYHQDEGVKYFSGTAAYATRFTVSADATAGGRRLHLDLGRVQVLAEVMVNGRNLGVLWAPPFRVDVTDAIHPGENELEVRVTNLWPNRLIGDERRPVENKYADLGDGRGGAIAEIPEWYKRGEPKPGARITFTTWKHYNAYMPLLESGLLGPVILRTAVSIPLTAP